MTKKTKKLYWKLVNRLGKALDEKDDLTLENLFEDTFIEAYKAGVEDKKTGQNSDYVDPALE